MNIIKYLFTHMLIASSIFGMDLKTINYPTPYSNLHRETFNKNIDAVRKMLELPGIDVDARNDIGETALNVASCRGTKALVQLLLSKNADINLEDILGMTALHCAALSGDLEVVKLLLSVGADINAQDKNGQTALHWAASNGYNEVVKLLLSMGANIDAVDSDGWTALHVAAEQSYLSCRATACNNSHREVFELLKSSGARTTTMNSRRNMHLVHSWLWYRDALMSEPESAKLYS